MAWKKSNAKIQTEMTFGSSHSPKLKKKPLKGKPDADDRHGHPDDSVNEVFEGSRKVKTFGNGFRKER